MRTAFALVAAVALAGSASAAPIVSGSTYFSARAIQDITLLPGTPFNPTGSAILLDDLFGDGYLQFNRDAQIGSTIAFPALDGQFFGSHPLLGSYVFGRLGVVTPNDFSGQITNVVQDPTDPGFAAGDPSSFVSGDFTFGGDRFGFEFLTGPAAGIILYTDPTNRLEFSAVFDGLPPSPGTTLVNSGAEVLDVLFNGQVVATSSDRRIVVTAAVPEPASVALLAAGGVGLLGYARRRAAGRPA